jgi:nuclear GTP-binding protein
MTLKQKYKIQKKVREHHRRLRKEAKKAKKAGLAIKHNSKVTRIPNLYPKKQEELDAQDLRKELEKLSKQKGAVITKEDIENMVKEGTGKVMNE